MRILLEEVSGTVCLQPARLTSPGMDHGAVETPETESGEPKEAPPSIVRQQQFKVASVFGTVCPVEGRP